MPRKTIAPQRRDQIVEALFECLANKGHERVTVKDIAEQADLHYGVIHYYFKSKDDIVSAMADSIISKYGNLLLERIRPIDSTREKLQVALDFLVDEFIFNRRLNRVFYNLVQMAFERKAVRYAIRKQLREYRGFIATEVEEGIVRGEITARDSQEIASMMVALVEGMALQWMIEPKALNRVAVRKQISEMLEKHLNES
jgi:AcrR family transcriptional regulator